LKAGLWFRRGRLVMVSPVHGIMPLSGRKSTYPSCSDSPSQIFSSKYVRKALNRALFHPDLAGARDGAEILSFLADEAQHFGGCGDARCSAKITNTRCNRLIT